MRKIFTRPFNNADVRTLDAWRHAYQDADLEIPHGFMGPNVETVISHKDGKIVQSLTGILSIILDPQIRDPHADPLDVIYGLRLLETVLTYKAQELGAVDAYIAIPERDEHYIELLKKVGYSVTVQKCVVMRRPLRPDHVPLLGAARDAAAAAASIPTHPELSRPTVQTSTITSNAPLDTDVK